MRQRALSRLNGWVTPEAIFLVLDQAWEHTIEASQALERLKNSFGTDELDGMDLLAHPPATLACLMRFTSADAVLEAAPTVAAEAKRGGFRVLDLSRLEPAEQQHFYWKTLPRFRAREDDVQNLKLAFDRMLESLALASPLTALPTPPPDTVMPVRFASSRQMLAAFGRELSPKGVYIECDAFPLLGEELTVSLETGSGQGPCQLSAKVTQVLDDEEALAAGRKSGFFAEFLLRGEEPNLLEAFLIAVARGGRWPERSGRRYERFPIRLSAEYVFKGQNRVETTGNLSRGGVFLISPRPPPAGTDLRLKLSATGGASAVELAGVVAHVEKGGGGFDPGAGVRFVDPPALVRTRLAQLLGESTTPKSKKAMIVDDDRFFRTVFKGELERAGYEVMEAGSGDDAFGLLLTQLLRLDVLIVDLHMPGMRGHELITRITQVGRDPDLAVAVLTGAKLAPETVRELQAIGADVVVNKSESPDTVVKKLAMAIQTRREAAAVIT